MKLDVLFVNPHSGAAYQNLGVYRAVETPTWSLLLAQSCRSRGHSVQILDCDAENLTYDEAVDRIKEISPRLVCFVVYGQNPNSGTTNMEGATEVAKRLKQQSILTTMFIGSHVSALPLEVLSYPFVDWISINEGVYTLHELLGSSKAFKDISGLGYKQDGRRFLNSGKVVPQERMDIDLPGYAWDLLPYKNKPLDLYRAHFWHAEFNHDYQTPFAAIYTSLGCRFKCNFCMINILNRTSTEDGVYASNFNTMRFWSPEFIVKEFDKLNDLGVSSIRISDEMFFLDKRYFEPLLNSLVERDYSKNLRMWAYSRIDTVRDKYLDLFRRAGIKWLALGIEAANRNVRLEVTKGSFKDVDINDVVKSIGQYDINVIANYIYGLPGDTMETMEQTKALSLELNTEMMNCYPAMALPGSELHQLSLQAGEAMPKKFSEWGFLSYDCIPRHTDTLTAADVLRFRDQAWIDYFKNPAYLELVKRKFGQVSHDNNVAMAKIQLKRKLLGD